MSEKAKFEQELLEKIKNQNFNELDSRELLSLLSYITTYRARYVNTFLNKSPELPEITALYGEIDAIYKKKREKEGLC